MGKEWKKKRRKGMPASGQWCRCGHPLESHKWKHPEPSLCWARPRGRRCWCHAFRDQAILCDPTSNAEGEHHMVVIITEDAFWASMKAAKRQPEILQQNTPTQQLIVGWRVTHQGQPTALLVKVYTSIFGPKGAGRSKGVGQDSIRICLVDTEHDRGVGKTHYTTRTTGWEQRLQEKVVEMFELANEQIANPAPDCPLCKGSMVQRRSSWGPFWGCCSFPRCKGLRQIPVATTTRPATAPVTKPEPEPKTLTEMAARRKSTSKWS